MLRWEKNARGRTALLRGRVREVDSGRPLPNALSHLLDGSSLDPDALEPPGRSCLDIGLYHGCRLRGLGYSSKGHIEGDWLLSLGLEVGDGFV
jgi:hypothetical protein